MSGELDTGACVSVIDYTLYVQHFSAVKLLPVFDKNCNNADGNVCQVLGKMNVCLNFKYYVQAIVIKSVKLVKPLIGRTWLDVLCPTWREYFDNNIQEVSRVCSIENDKLIENVLVRYADVFKSSSEPIIGVKVKLELKSDFFPKFCKSAVVPFSLREKVASQLKEKQDRGIIDYVEESDWASQIVVVPKKTGDLRICCNYKNTSNPQLRDNKYPLPVIDYLLSELGGSSCFVLLGLEGAYAQLLLDEESRPLELLTLIWVY